MDLLPLHLQSVSPRLAAFHICCIRRLHPDKANFDNTHCSRCGSFILDGSSDTRTVSLKNRGQAHSRRRVMQKSCRSCGFVSRLPLEPGNAVIFPKRSKGNKPAALPQKPVVEPPIPIPTPVASTSQTSASPSPTPDSNLPKSKTRKKKSGLQDLLARNRARQEQEKNSTAQARNSLASFLGGL